MLISVDAIVSIVRPPIEAVVLLTGLDDSQHVGQQFESGCRLDGNDRRRVYHECLHPVRDTCDLPFFGANHHATWEKGKPCGWAGWVGGCCCVGSVAALTGKQFCQVDILPPPDLVQECLGNGRDIPCPTNSLSKAAAVVCSGTPG